MVNPLNSVESRPRLGIMRSKFSELEAASTALREQLAKAEASLAELTEKNENLTGNLRNLFACHLANNR